MSKEYRRGGDTGLLEGWLLLADGSYAKQVAVADQAVGVGVPVTVTLVDHSISSATGASQQLLAANAARKALTIINPSSSLTNWTIDPTGATVVADIPPGFRLAPGDEWSPTKVPLNAITAIGTAAAKLVVLEG